MARGEMKPEAKTPGDSYAILRAVADAMPHDYTCDCGHIRRRLVTPAGQAQRGGA